MKIVIRILLGIGLLILLVLVTALFVKKDHKVERSIVVNKPNDEVFEYIKHVKNQDQYSKWNLTDPAMKKEYKGTDGTVGFVSMWDSENKNVGKGEQEITNIVEGKRLDMKLHFIKPFDGLASACMSTEPIEANQTTVTWSFENSMPYPMNIMCLFMNMDDIIGKDLQTGLGNLKAILEK